MSVGHFLAGIGALIWDPATGKYLFLRRADQRDFQQGAWECVTGRVDQGENFEQALHREVGEEIGAEVQIEFIVSTTHFYRGEARPENELLGLIYGCTILNPEAVSCGDEHSELRWASAEEAKSFLPERHWLRKVLRRAERLRAELPESLREAFRAEGFEL
jgi:8-oxo-dGTP pyrophosphatase MutT (NUDIX family)